MKGTELKVGELYQYKDDFGIINVKFIGEREGDVKYSFEVVSADEYYQNYAEAGVIRWSAGAFRYMKPLLNDGIKITDKLTVSKSKLKALLA